MNARKEQALVGLFVLIAAGLLIATLLALRGISRENTVRYRAYFKFAGGLEPGTTVRFGGVKVGRVKRVRIDPQDSTRVEIDFGVRPDTPVKTDSTAKIYSLSALGDNYLEVTTGSGQSPRAPAGSVLKSADYAGLPDLVATLSDMTPEVRQLLESLNGRAAELRETIARVNDLLSDKNRASIGASLDDVRGMLAENRPRLKATMGNLESASVKAQPLLADFQKTARRADKALADVDSVLGENRQDIRKATAELRQTLAGAETLVEQLNGTLSYNGDDIDQILENIRATTENLREFTDSVKSRPYTLIRASSFKEHKPGTARQP